MNSSVSSGWQIPANEARASSRCRQIAAELIREGCGGETLLILTESTHFPHNLVLPEKYRGQSLAPGLRQKG